MTLINRHHAVLIGTFIAFLIIPASTSFAQQRDPLPTSFPGAKLLSPAQGATVRPGQEVTVDLEIDPALNPGFVFIMGNIFSTGISLEMNGPPFKGKFKIPEKLAGPIELAVLFKNTSDKMIGGLGLNLNVIPAEAPQSIDAGRHDYLRLPAVRYLPSRTITVKGYYNNGSKGKIRRDISHSVTGTRYRSSDSKVFTINEGGVMEPVAPGSAFVIVEHRGLKDFVAIDVIEKIERSNFPAVDHTADVSITASSPRHIKDTVRYEMDVVIRNNADLPLHLPLHLVITDLADDVRIADAMETSLVEPVGSPYVFVELNERGYLSPGNSARAKVIFVKFNREPLDHTLKLFAGGNM